VVSPYQGVAVKYLARGRPSEDAKAPEDHNSDILKGCGVFRLKICAINLPRSGQLMVIW
jgi:hypothetical protein